MEKSGYSAMRSSISCPMERAACCNAPAARRNVAVGVARLGGDSGFIGRVGDDPSAVLCVTPRRRSKWM